MLESLSTKFWMSFPTGFEITRCLLSKRQKRVREAIQIYDDARRFSFRSPLKTAIACGGLVTGNEMIVEGCNILVANQEKLLKYVEHCTISFEMVQYLGLG